MGTGKQRISTAARLEAKAEGEPVLELELALVQAELELVPVVAARRRGPAAVALRLVPVAAELELAQVVVELAPGRVEVARRFGPVAVALRTKSVTAAHRRGLVPVLAAGDLAAAAEITREPAAAEEATAWEVADLAAAAVGAEAVEDAGDKRDFRRGKTNENENKHRDFAKNFSERFRDPDLLRFSRCFIRRAGEQTRCSCGVAAKTKGIRHTETGGRCPYSGSRDF